MTSFADTVAGMPVEQRRRLAELLVPRMPPGYSPEKPHPTQQAFLLLSHTREVLFGGGSGGGKALWTGTPVLTTAGWKTQGTVQPGDFVYGHDGRPVRVLAVSELIDEPCYALRFATGETVLAGERHRWVVQTDRDRRNLERRGPDYQAQRRATRPSRSRGADSLKPGTGAAAMVNNAVRAAAARAVAVPVDPWEVTRTLDTRDVAELDRTERKRLSVPRPPAINAPGQWPLATRPWALGMWLGDGTTHGSSITHGDEDAELLIAGMARDGYPLRHRNGTHFSFDGLSSDLSADLGPYRTRVKRIPDAVYAAAYADRMAVAQGLVDSDGHINTRGQVEFCLTNELLFRDAIRLFATLGIRVSQTVRKAGYTVDGVRRDTGMRYGAKFTTELPVATYPRKLDHITAAPLSPTDRGRRASIFLRSIAPTATVPLRCIQVDDPRGVYLAGETLIPTHNSSSLLQAALQYVDVPGYSALILRRTYPDLILPGAIMDRAKAWLEPTDAKGRDGGITWTFPSGARLTFGYLQHDNDRLRYQSAEYAFVALDELTQWPRESTYTYLFSRLRKPTRTCVLCGGSIAPALHNGAYKHTGDRRPSRGHEPCDEPLPDADALARYPPAPDGTTLFDVPLRMRAASNPGGPGGAWVRQRFIDPKTRAPGAMFVPSLLQDNPSLNQEEYEATLAYLDPVERKRLLEGDWDVHEETGRFRRDWWRFDRKPPKGRLQLVRSWDFAASAGAGDWTVGALLGRKGGTTYVLDIVREQLSPAGVESLVAATAAADGTAVHVLMEQEPGSSGKAVMDHYARKVLPGFVVRPQRSTGDKMTRAAPLASAAEKGYVHVVVGEWVRAFLDEAVVFPAGAHDDQVDAVAAGFNYLAHARESAIIA